MLHNPYTMSTVNYVKKQIIKKCNITFNETSEQPSETITIKNNASKIINNQIIKPL